MTGTLIDVWALFSGSGTWTASTGLKAAIMRSQPAARRKYSWSSGFQMTGWCFASGQINQGQTFLVKIVCPLVLPGREFCHFNDRLYLLTGSQSRSSRSLFWHRPSDGLQAAGQLRWARLPRPRRPAVRSQLPGQKRWGTRGASASSLGHHAARYSR